MIAFSSYSPTNGNGSVAPTRPPDRGEFRFAGFGCSSIEMTVPVDIRRAGASLPQGFALFRDRPGKALIAFRVTSFEVLLMDGTLAVAPVLSEIGLQIEAPDQSGGTHFYLLAQATNHGAVARRMRRPGFETETLDLVGFREVGVRHSGHRGVLGKVGSEAWPFSVSARVDQPMPATGTVLAAVWHVGTRGPLCCRTEGRLFRRAIASGEIRTRRGTRVNRLIGGATAPATGTYEWFDAAGSVRRRPIG